MAYIGFGPLNTFSPVPSKDSFTGDGSTTTFDLENEVVFGGENALEVFVDNVRQEPGTGKAYTLDLDGSLANKRITFSAAPANGASIYVINDKTSNTTIISPTDLNGVEFILDADADTSITADTDDRIDFKLNGTDHIQLGTSSGDTTIKIATDAKDLQFLQADGRNILEINDAGYVALGNGATGSGQLRIYEDTDNGTNYSAFQVGTQSADITYTLPTADGTSGFQLTTNGSGVLSWAAAQIALANDGNNRIVTGTGSAGLNAEAGLTYDGSTLAVTGAVTVSTSIDVDGTTNLDAVDIDGAVQIDATLTVGVDDTGYDVKLFGDTASAFMLWDASADDLILSGAAGLIVPDGQFTLGSTAITSTGAEINILDGGNAASSVTLVDADRIIVNDNGTMKQVAVSALNTYTSASIAADDISAGDGAVNITTSSGNITIDAAAGDADIIFKGTDGSSDITALTLDMSADGAAIFKSSIAAVSLDISGDVDVDGTLEADAITVDGTTLAEFISDTTGAMFSSNTETGITVTYQDGDNTIDLALAAAQTTITSLLATDIKIGEDDQTKIDFEVADEIHFYAANAEQVYVADGIFGPQTDSDVDLGTTGVRWKNAYIDTITTTGLITSGAGLVIADAGTIGSASDVDAIAIGSDGDVTLTQDLELQHDGAILSFGANDEISLTHVHDTGLLLNSTNKLQFNDASQFIQGASATVLDIAATDEIELTATLIEVVGNATVSGTLGVTGVTTSNAGVVVDDITIDGTEIDLSSGDLTVDVAGDIILDAGGGNIKVSVATTQILDIANSSSDVIIKPVVDAKDIIFQQRDGTSILEINDGAYARFTAAAVAPEATLTDASTVTWNALTQSVAKVTLGGNRTIGLASGGVAGAFISILVIQDGTGSRTVTWNAAYEFTGNTAPTLTTTANLGDLFVFRYNGAKWLETGRNLALTLS